MTGKTNHGDSAARLSQADAALWDAMMAQAHARQGLADIPLDRTAQARQIQRLMAILNAANADLPLPSEDLVQRTLSQIQQQENRRRFAMQVDALVTPDPAFRWRELSAVAAVLMIGMAVMWPVLSQARQEARRVACQQHLGVAGQAMARYASDNAGMMPRYGSLPSEARGISGAAGGIGGGGGGGSWAGVGYGYGASPREASLNGQVVRSNPAQLYLLVRKGYISPDDLACPDNVSASHRMTVQMHDWPNAASVSYSYQNQLAPGPLRLEVHPQMVILADKNPLFSASLSDPRLVVYRPDLLPTSATVFHQQSGQNMLSGSGQVRWSRQPMTLNGDNIWTADGVTHYTGIESPSHESDSFLVP